MTTFTRRRAAAVLTAGAAALSVAAAVVPYTQGFEADTAGWFDSATESAWYGTVTRVASGTDGIASSVGSFHAVVEGDGVSAPFSRFSAYADEFTDGYTASIDVFLDPAWADAQGFDLSVAASRVDGSHLRDFIVHVSKDTSTGQLLVGASNNTNFAVRQDLENLANHAVVTEAAWYQLRWTFRDAGGVLAVDVELLDASGASLFLETRTTAADTIGDGGVVGGNRYMWFTTIDNGLALHVDQQDIGLPGPTTKDDCKDGGHAAYGYRNQGACVSDLTSNRPAR